MYNQPLSTFSCVCSWLIRLRAASEQILQINRKKMVERREINGYINPRGTWRDYMCAIWVMDTVRLQLVRVPASEGCGQLMIGNNHEKDRINLLETCKDTAESQWAMNSIARSHSSRIGRLAFDYSGLWRINLIHSQTWTLRFVHTSPSENSRAFKSDTYTEMRTRTCRPTWSQVG